MPTRTSKARRVAAELRALTRITCDMYIYIYIFDTCACHSSSKFCCNSWQLNVTLERKISLPMGFSCPGKLDGHSGLRTGTHPDPRREEESNHRILSPGNVPSLNATRKRPLRLSRKRHRMGSRNLKEGGDHADPQGHCPPHGGTGRDSPMVTVFKSFPTTRLQMSCMLAGRGEQICCCSWIKPLLMEQDITNQDQQQPPGCQKQHNNHPCGP